MADIKVIFPKASEYYIEKHKDIDKWNELILLLWGGRFGAKSETVARRLVKKCLIQSYFRCILARKVFATVKDSQWQTIKDFVDNNGLSELFRFIKSPLEIHCINGNSFLCRGFDKAEKIKSIKDPTDFWGEELAEFTEHDFETAITTLRSKKVKTQFIGTFNPETE